jgi:hypothetical protein
MAAQNNSRPSHRRARGEGRQVGRGPARAPGVVLVLGFGRIVVSEIEAPNMLAVPV